MRHFFRVFKEIYFLEGASLFVSFINRYCLSQLSKVLTERPLRNICPCFDIVFAQLGVIPRARNKFVEKVAAAERYLIITHVKKKSKKKSFRMYLPVIIRLTWWKNINKKGTNLFVSSLQYCLPGQDGWKSRNFFRKINWRWTCSQIFRKFSHWENLNLNDVKYRICLSLEFEYRLWVIIFTQERVPKQTFTTVTSTIEALKKMWILFKADNKNTWTTFYFF